VYEERRVIIQGIDISYIASERASSQGPTVIMLHGFGGTKESFRFLFERVVGPRAVYACDRPGFGDTSRPLPPYEDFWQKSTPYTRESQVEILRLFMDALNIEKAILVGHSVGGIIARLFALKYPSRVAGIILINSSIYGKGFAPRTLRILQSRPGRIVGPLFLKVFRKSFHKMIDGEFFRPERITDESRAIYNSLFEKENWKEALWEYISHATVLRENEHLNQLSAFTGPVLLIHGREDGRVSVEQSMLQEKTFASSRLHIIEDCGHLAPEEKPDETAGHIEEFLKTLE